ncbi:hypothetical protein OF83DRAFT_1175511 [Amylostereum chailletii]|nr:hypothetical protein OF83DRAFT_1175511 [Amylostereum chailletii]
MARKKQNKQRISSPSPQPSFDSRAMCLPKSYLRKVGLLDELRKGFPDIVSNASYAAPADRAWPENTREMGVHLDWGILLSGRKERQLIL